MTGLAPNPKPNDRHVQHRTERRVSKPVPSHRERDDAYRYVVVWLNEHWRVIECRDGIQWILQRSDGERHGQTRWSGRSYCRTRNALIRASRDLAGEIDGSAMAILEGLPEWIGGRP